MAAIFLNIVQLRQLAFVFLFLYITTTVLQLCNANDEALKFSGLYAPDLRTTSEDYAGAWLLGINITLYLRNVSFISAMII